MLLSSSKKWEEEIDNAKRTYSQSLPGINDPVLKSMCFGPDSTYKPAGQEDIDCDLQQDEHEMRIFNFNVKHNKCSDLEKWWEKFWYFSTQA